MMGLEPDTLAIVTAVLKSLVILLVVVISAALLSFIERRLLALWQDRYGPNRVGPFGMFQLGADMIKMFFKADWTPPFADRQTFWLAAAIAMSSLLIAFVVIPITPTWGVSDLNVGLLFFLAMAGLGVYAVIFAGWSSNNKYALLGGLRSTAQTVTYEVFMGLSVMGVVAIAGSFNLRDIVDAQQGLWFIIPQFLGFITFAMAGVAVAHRHPFDLPEAEQELAAGYHTEYSGLKWGMFFVGEYVAIVLVSAMLVTLFLGGWHGPWLPPFIWFALKTAFFIMLFILLRATLPRPRYDQMMAAGWKVCLPLTLINLLVTGAVVLMPSPAGYGGAGDQCVERDLEPAAQPADGVFPRLSAPQHHPVSGAAGAGAVPLSGAHRADPRSRWGRALRCLQSLRGGLSGGLYRVTEGGDRRWSLVPGVFPDQFLPLHFLRHVRGSLPDQCDSAHTGFRNVRIRPPATGV